MTSFNRIVALFTLGALLLAGRGAHADDRSTLVLVPILDPAQVDSGRQTRNTGIGLTVAGTLVTFASQVLLGFAVLSTINTEGPNARPIDSGLAISAALTVIAGNVMLGAGLGLWGNGNHRMRDRPRSRGSIGFSASAAGQPGASSTMTVAF